jgi:hypothetical protein
MPRTRDEYVVWEKKVLEDAAIETVAREKENFAVLAAVGLLHPSMTPFDVDMYGLARTVWDDPALLAAVVANEGPLEKFEDGSYEVYEAEAYADAFNALSPEEQEATRARILANDGWKLWAAAHT